MSASPFIKRTKPRANARQRDESISGPSSAGDANNVEDEDDGMSISPMLMAKNRKKEKEKKKTGSIGKSRLSFGGDDEDGMEEKTFVPRKSKLSQSISLQKAATTAAAASTIALNSGDYHNPFASKPASTPSTSSSVYNNAYLQELKASTPTRSARPRADEEGVINMEVDEAMNPFQPSASGSGMGQYQVLDTTQGIPDEALIAAAKAKRKTAVGTGVSSGSGLGGEDYISITQDNGKLALFDSDIKSGPHPESRLQREEDEEGDGDEGELNLGMVGLGLGNANGVYVQTLPTLQKRTPRWLWARTLIKQQQDG
jgi:GC-rich sequence DNA-binding factor